MVIRIRRFEIYDESVHNDAVEVEFRTVVRLILIVYDIRYRSFGCIICDALAPDVSSLVDGIDEAEVFELDRFCDGGAHHRRDPVDASGDLCITPVGRNGVVP